MCSCHGIPKKKRMMMSGRSLRSPEMFIDLFSLNITQRVNFTIAQKEGETGLPQINRP